jgi:ribosome-associated heat shock protein Hsp15
MRVRRPYVRPPGRLLPLLRRVVVAEAGAASRHKLASSGDRIEDSFIAATNTNNAEEASARIDRWLWAVRVFKTRALAADACRNGQVTVAGSEAKPSRLVRPGFEVYVKRPLIQLRLRVIEPIEKRVGAKLVAEFVEDLTSEEAKLAAEAAAAERRANAVRLEPGMGRPSKRQRRSIEAFLEQIERGSQD